MSCDRRDDSPDHVYPDQSPGSPCRPRGPKGSSERPAVPAKVAAGGLASVPGYAARPSPGAAGSARPGAITLPTPMSFRCNFPFRPRSGPQLGVLPYLPKLTNYRSLRDTHPGRWDLCGDRPHATERPLCTRGDPEPFRHSTSIVPHAQSPLRLTQMTPRSYPMMVTGGDDGVLVGCGGTTYLTLEMTKCGGW